MAVDLALQRAKRVLPVKIIGGQSLVVPERYERLISSFGHIMRNMIDHGIEAPAEREAAGKRPEGSIGIEIRDKGDEITFSFSDDGRGIELDKVEARARSLGLIDADEHPPAPRLMEFLFHDTFSTAGNVTVVSGRGVGLSAVRQSVREVGGRINIATRTGKGTTFTVTVPDKRSRRNTSEG
jgi:chemotaxis protein histidine kinase CheA